MEKIAVLYRYVTEEFAGDWQPVGPFINYDTASAEKDYYVAKGMQVKIMSHEKFLESGIPAEW